MIIDSYDVSGGRGVLKEIAWKREYPFFLGEIDSSYHCYRKKKRGCLNLFLRIIAGYNRKILAVYYNI